MATRISEPDIATATKDLLKAALHNLDKAGFVLSAAHLDMVINVFEMEVSDNMAPTMSPPKPEIMRQNASAVRQSVHA